MRNPILARVLAACCAIAACTSPQPKPVSVESRLAAQNALFEEQYQSDLKTHPERATAYHEGIPGHHMQQSVAPQMTDLPK